jgi:hypothetical protein
VVPSNKLEDHLQNMNNPIVRLDHELDNLSLMTEINDNNQKRREEITVNKNYKLHPLIAKLKKQSINKNNTHLKNNSLSKPSISENTD